MTRREAVGVDAAVRPRASTEQRLKTIFGSVVLLRLLYMQFESHASPTR
jgi:hypothetical protein